MASDELPDWERLLAAAQSSGASPLAEVVERMATAAPADAPQVDLRT